MKRSPSSRRGRSSREADKLIKLAEGLASSGSRAEDRFWERSLDDEISELLSNGDEGALNVALDRLADGESRAYEELADAVEGVVEFAQLTDNKDGPQSLLLFAAPLLAWSRVSIPARNLPSASLKGIKAAFAETIFASGCRIAVTDYLWSPDQLPESFGETAALRAKLTESILKNKDLSIDPKELPEIMPFLADVRYLLGVAIAADAAPIFAWQDGEKTREQALQAWRAAASAVLTPLFPACAVEILAPGAYYTSCRDADKAARPFSIKASVAFLSTTLAISTQRIEAIVGACYDQRLEEYRIGFSVNGQPEVVHGVVWPLLGAEDELGEVTEEIEVCLRESGVGRTTLLEQRLPLEYCEDCGSPLYPNAEGELVHAELPEQLDMPSQQLH